MRDLIVEMAEALNLRFALSALFLGVVCIFATARTSGTAPTMGEQPGGGVLVPSNQLITPVGKIVRIENERPKDLALSPDGKLVAVLAQSRLSLLASDGTSVAEMPLKAGPLGLAWMPDSRSLFVSGDNGQIYRVEGLGSSWKISHSFLVADLTVPPAAEGGAAIDESRLEWRPTSREHHHLAPVKEPSKHHGNPQVTGLAVSPDGHDLYVALGIRNAIAVVDSSTEKVIASVPVGVAPYRIALSPKGDTLFVANRGGRPARPKEPQDFSAGVSIRIDPATGAALRGSVSFIDTKTYATNELEEGRQPSGLTTSPDGRTLYVANSDDDTVAAIDIATRRIRTSCHCDLRRTPDLVNSRQMLPWPATENLSMSRAAARMRSQSFRCPSFRSAATSPRVGFRSRWRSEKGNCLSRTTKESDLA